MFIILFIILFFILSLFLEHNALSTYLPYTYDN